MLTSAVSVCTSPIINLFLIGSYEDDVQKAADAINIISLEEVRMSNSEAKKVRKQTSGGYDPGPKSGGGYHGGQHVQQQKKYYSASEMRQAREVSRGTSQINMISAGNLNILLYVLFYYIYCLEKNFLHF
jgi:hypothetical protein